MASDREYRDFILEQLSETEGISCRAMMGEYIIYLREKVVGGIYDNRLLIKPTPTAVKLLPGAAMELPYSHAKPMLQVDMLEDRKFISVLFNAVYEELPEPRKKKNKRV